MNPPFSVLTVGLGASGAAVTAATAGGVVDRSGVSPDAPGLAVSAGGVSVANDADECCRLSCS